MTEQDLKQEIDRHMKAIGLAVYRYVTEIVQKQNKEEKETVLRRN